jgi:Protein of unknown function (DUF1326)
MSLKQLLGAGALLALVAAALLAVPAAPVARAAGTAGPEWAANTTVIEACSCPMFCQCYFNTKPSGHSHSGAGAGAEHFCRANLAHKINKGHYGTTSLDGVKFWVSSDLGGDFSQGQMEWAVLTFDKAMTPAQREAVQAIVGNVFPVKWRSFKTAEGTIDTWKFDKDTAVATLDGGKSGEVRLKRFAGMTADPIVIRNLPYWGVKRHEGFVLMPNEVEAYRVGPNAFEFKGTNGFMITWDMTSKDVAAPAAGK